MAKVTDTIQGGITINPPRTTETLQPTAEAPIAVQPPTSYQKTLMETDGRIKTSSMRTPWIPNFMVGTNLRDLASDRVKSRLNFSIIH